MAIEDKFADQARLFVVNDSYRALPLQGQGRWADTPAGRLYTDDAEVLFLKGDGSSRASLVYHLLDRYFKEGKSAAEAFDLLIGDSPVTVGDLASLG